MSDDDALRHEAAERLRAMAPHHRDGVCSILLGVAAWMEYVNNVDDPDDHARAVASAWALLGAADPTPVVDRITVDAMAWYCSTCNRPRPEIAKTNAPCPACHSYEVYGRGVGHTTESGTHCSCGRALPCRHCTQET